MFEGLPIVTIPMPAPISFQNFRGRLECYADALNADNLPAFNAAFSISGGKIQTVLPIPDSAAPGEDFMRIQTFVYMDSDANYYTIRRDFESYLLSYTYAGAGELVYGGSTYTLTPGSGFLIDCRIPHQYRTHGDFWQHSDLHFFGGEADALYREYEKDRSAQFFFPADRYQPQLEGILKRYTGYSAHKNCFISGAISALIVEILLSNEAKAGAMPPAYQNLVKYIETHYSQPISLDLLASRANVSKYHLCREFRKYTGHSPADYIIEFRINHAKFLLRSTDLPACKIGKQVGIPNETNFLRHFKKKTGLTPSQYRSLKRSFL